MAEDIIQNITDQLQDVNVSLAKAKDYIKLLKEVGEDTTAIESKIRTLETKKNKWEMALKKRSGT